MIVLEKIDTSKLKNGEYSLSIFHGGKMINQQQVRINR